MKLLNEVVRKTLQIALRRKAYQRRRPMVSSTSAAWRAPVGVYNASNISTRCFVFPWRICVSVLYLSRPDATIFMYSWSLCVNSDCSLAASNSALSDYSDDSYNIQRHRQHHRRYRYWPFWNTRIANNCRILLKVFALYRTPQGRRGTAVAVERWSPSTKLTCTVGGQKCVIKMAEP